MPENIEWTNVWREHCREDRVRVLIVGDSIMNGSRIFIGKELGDDFAITAFTTSKAMDDPFFLRELDTLLDQEACCYKAVYFNNGLHMGGLSDEAYRTHYEKALDHIGEKLPGVPVILGLSTPLTEPCKGNETVISRNEQVRDVAAARGLQVVDAYQVMVGHPEWKCPDGCHYLDDGYRALSRVIAEALRSAVG